MKNPPIKIFQPAQPAYVLINGTDYADILWGTDLNDEMHGGKGDDTLYGGKGNDKLFGEDNNDKLYGGYGNNELDGGAGNDTFYCGLGNDKVIGGIGNDTLNFSVATTQIILTSIGSSASYVSNDGRSSGTLSGVENFVGSAYDDVLELPESWTTSLTINGGGGNDTLKGTAADDTIIGGAGRDELWGRGGYDTLTGGAERDVFHFTRNTGLDGPDTVTDFQMGLDKIKAEQWLGSDHMLARGTNVYDLDFDTGSTNNDGLFWDTDDNMLFEIMYYEGQTQGTPILIAQFGTNVQLTTADFI